TPECFERATRDFPALLKSRNIGSRFLLDPSHRLDENRRNLLLLTRSVSEGMLAPRLLFLTPRVAEGPSPMELQHSIGKAVVCEGVGLHTGAAVTMTLHPAPADRGVMFRVGAERRRVPVRPESLVNGHYATTLGSDGVQIQTVEHFLAAVRGLAIDNLLVE